MYRRPNQPRSFKMMRAPEKATSDCLLPLSAGTVLETRTRAVYNRPSTLVVFRVCLRKASAVVYYISDDISLQPHSSLVHSEL